MYPHLQRHLLVRLPQTPWRSIHRPLQPVAQWEGTHARRLKKFNPPNRRCQPFQHPFKIRKLSVMWVGNRAKTEDLKLWHQGNQMMFPKVFATTKTLGLGCCVGAGIDNPQQLCQPIWGLDTRTNTNTQEFLRTTEIELAQCPLWALRPLLSLCCPCGPAQNISKAEPTERLTRMRCLWFKFQRARTSQELGLAQLTSSNGWRPNTTTKSRDEDEDPGLGSE